MNICIISTSSQSNQFIWEKLNPPLRDDESMEKRVKLTI